MNAKQTLIGALSVLLVLTLFAVLAAVVGAAVLIWKVV